MKIDDLSSKRASDAPRSAMSPAHLRHETRSHMAKIKKKMRVYKVCVIKESEKILYMVLSP